MIVYPAMDLMGGCVVRLRQGRFDDATSYSINPEDALHGFADAGAEWAHIVDLDGARAGAPVQHDLIAEIAKSTPLKIQVAGGFRELRQLGRMFDAGVARAVVGSVAVKAPETVRNWLEEFGPDRLVLALDVRLMDGTPRVAMGGWAEDSGGTLWDVASHYPQVRHLLITDIGRDGMLGGPNFELYEEVACRLPGVRVQASGGISSLLDIGRLMTDGAIVGKALWENRFSLEEALGCARA